MMPDRRVVLPAKEEQMSDIHVLAIDLAKRSFQVCATALGGACGCPQLCKVILRRFYGSALVSLVCQASVCGLQSPRAGMQFEERGPHRFRELCRSSPGTGFLVLNIEVLAA